MWDEHRGLALDMDSQGQSSIVEEVRFTKPLILPGNGWFQYFGDCQPQGPQQCSNSDVRVVRDSTWCVVVGANFTDQSMLLACVGAPNGLEGGVNEWKGVCVPPPNGQHLLSSLMTLIYVDPWGVRSYKSSLIPAVPLDTWVTLQASVGGSSNVLYASMSVSVAGEEYPPLDAEFAGATLNQSGLVGVQPGVMPQTFCTGFYGRPVRSMAMKCGGLK